MITADSQNVMSSIKSEPLYQYYHYYYNSQLISNQHTHQNENLMDTSSNSSSSSSSCHNQVDIVCQPEVRPTNRGGRKQVKVGTNKRNARERNRVRFINNCFEILREHIPHELAINSIEQNPANKNQKLSKVETLKLATLYIKQLSELLMLADEKADDKMSSISTKIEASCTNVIEDVQQKNETCFYNATIIDSSSPPDCSASPSSTTSGVYHSCSSASSQYSLSPKYYNYESVHQNQSQLSHALPGGFTHREIDMTCNSRMNFGFPSFFQTTAYNSNFRNF